MELFGQVVRQGRWLYADSVETAVRVRQSEVRYGSGDYEDPAEFRDDVAARCFYVEWDGSGTGRAASMSGPFNTLAEAEAFAERQAGGTLRWIS